MDELTLDEALEELEAAEDFLNYFGVAFDPAVVHVNRLHILQRFHDYITKAEPLPAAEAERRTVYSDLLEQAYEDFVLSDALTEKVFKVFHMHGPQTTFVPLTDLTVAGKAAAATESSCGCGGTGACHSSEAALRS